MYSINSDIHIFFSNVVRMCEYACVSISSDFTYILVI